MTDRSDHRIQEQIRAINSLISRNERQAAVQQATALLDQGQRHPFILSFLAHESLLQRDFSRAVQLSEEALQLSPENPSLKRNLGIALKDDGQYDRAVETFSSLINSGHPLPNLYHHLGSALHRAGQDYWSAVSFQKGLLIERSEHRLGVVAEAPSDVDLALAREGVQRIESQLRHQLDGLIDRSRRKAPESVTPRVQRLCEYLCQEPARLDALHRGQAAQLLDAPAALAWPVGLNRLSFDWLVQLEHRFVDLLEGSSVLLQPDQRHLWIEADAPESRAVASCPLIRQGHKQHHGLTAVDRMTDQIQSLLGQRVSNLLPEVTLFRLAPQAALEPPLITTSLMVTVLLPLIWPTGCQVVDNGESLEQVVGRLLVPAAETLVIRNDSSRDALFLCLNVAHPDLSAAERGTLNAILLELSSWITLCESFSPGELSLS